MWHIRPHVAVFAMTLLVLSLGLLDRPVPLHPITTAISPVIAIPRVEAAATQITNIPPQVPIPKAPVDCHQQACVALTFDDGPDPKTTPLILDTLDQEHVKATFFVIGNKVPANTALVQRMYQSGYEIGNHSWSHPDFTRLRPTQMLDQINQTQNALIAAGVGPAPFFRLPYGAQNRLVDQTIPLPIISWNVDPRDWQENNVDHLIVTLQATIKPGSIIELHDTKMVTVAALRQIIHNLVSAHMQPVTVSQLLNLTPDSRGQFFSQ